MCQERVAEIDLLYQLCGIMTGTRQMCVLDFLAESVVVSVLGMRGSTHNPVVGSYLPVHSNLLL